MINLCSGNFRQGSINLPIASTQPERLASLYVSYQSFTTPPDIPGSTWEVNEAPTLLSFICDVYVFTNVQGDLLISP